MGIWRKVDSIKNNKTSREKIAELEKREAERDQLITELELNAIENDLAVTELELAVLGLQAETKGE